MFKSKHTTYVPNGPCPLPPSSVRAWGAALRQVQEAHGLPAGPQCDPALALLRLLGADRRQVPHLDPSSHSVHTPAEMYTPPGPNTPDQSTHPLASIFSSTHESSRTPHPRPC